MTRKRLYHRMLALGKRRASPYDVARLLGDTIAFVRRERVRRMMEDSSVGLLAFPETTASVAESGTNLAHSTAKPS
jgi:hypothetical protein